MSYLDNQIITVDAILTKKGRERFSQGNFSITKFALADDEIDYSLYNTAHPSGSDYYATAIENLPLLEAIPDETKLMRYKLITLPKGTAQIPLISVGFTTTTLYAPWKSQPGETVIVTPSTVNGLNETLGYTATLYDTTYSTILVQTPVPGAKQPKKSDEDGGNSKSLIGKSFLIKATGQPPQGTIHTTYLTIHGNETGGSTVITVRIKRNQNTEQ